MSEGFTKNVTELPAVKNLTRALFDLDVPGSNPAFLWKGVIVTRQEVISAAAKIADFYSALDFAPTSRVILLLPDSPAFAVHFLGAILSELVPVPISPRMTPKEIESILDDSEADMLVSTPALSKQLVHDCFGFANRILVQTELCVSCAPVIKESPQRLFNLKGRSGGHASIAFWQYTSGSTGTPKAVMHSHQSAFAVCDAYARRTIGLMPEDRVFSVAKMSFGYGLGNSLLFPFQIGATSILVDEPCTPLAVNSIMQLTRPTVLFGVPSFYVRCLKEYQSGVPYDFSSLRFCISAGEALPPSIQNSWQHNFHVPIVDGLGATELLHIVLSNRPNDVTVGSLGRPLPTCRARIVNGCGEKVEAGAEGLLEIQTPFRMKGYWKDSAKKQEVMNKGWIRLGDICRKDTNGCYWYCGRANETFKVKGLWVSPIEIENALLSNDLVLDVIVFGKQNKDGLTEVAATVVPSTWPPLRNLESKLHDFLASLLSHHKCPTCYEFVKIISRTTTGKKNLVLLKELQSA